jgi:hypothetical protein
MICIKDLLQELGNGKTIRELTQEIDTLATQVKSLDIDNIQASTPLIKEIMALEQDLAAEYIESFRWLTGSFESEEYKLTTENLSFVASPRFMEYQNEVNAHWPGLPPLNEWADILNKASEQLETARSAMQTIRELLELELDHPDADMAIMEINRLATQIWEIEDIFSRGTLPVQLARNVDILRRNGTACNCWMPFWLGRQSYSGYIPRFIPLPSDKSNKVDQTTPRNTRNKLKKGANKLQNVNKFNRYPCKAKQKIGR